MSLITTKAKAFGGWIIGTTSKLIATRGWELDTTNLAPFPRRMRASVPSIEAPQSEESF